MYNLLGQFFFIISPVSIKSRKNYYGNMYYVMNYSIINSDSLGYPKLGFWNTFLAILDNEGIAEVEI